MDRRLISLYCTFALYRLPSSELGDKQDELLPSLGSDASRARVAVYTGTFDPVHRNHINLCRHLLEDAGYNSVHIFPNDDSPLKPYATPLQHRVRMLELAIDEAGLTGRCEVHDTTGRGGDWRAREQMCCEVVGLRGAVALLLGQDSFEKAVTRSSEAQSKRGSRRAHSGASSKGIFAFAQRGLEICVCPRAGYGEVDVPETLRHCTTVLSGYSDSCETSSSAIREVLSHDQSSLQAGSTDSLPLSVAVLEYISTHSLYTAPLVQTRRTLAVLGPPGSGRSTLARGLASWLSASRLLSWEEDSSESVVLLQELQRREEERVVIDGLQANDLPALERAAPSVKVDCIVEIHCSKSRCRAICLEQAPPSRSCTLASELNRYFSEASVRKEILKSFAGGGGRSHLPVHASETDSCDVVLQRCIEGLTAAGW
eukprot:TRINITY_DN21528_c0_g2_i1.p1 TRINITY_DN21528_c0_g2~~TRINITY_DN21528_c0_g2_i1.p1  ORF type:complete len:428 (+),score=67.00 TRINITY_DN21528_c0_g2_i1:646-1929(+)